MQSKTIRGLASSVSLIAAGAFGAGAALAQETEAVPQTKYDTIVITGSRLANPNLTSSSSVVVLGEQDIDTRGVLRVEDLLATLPQAMSGQGASSGVNGATATVNLRGLGADRTLVLVDGKRLPYGSPINVAADLNQIPSQLVERVEVLTGGATAVYGSDAVAGVVNFIMKRDFEGVQIDLQGSGYYAENNDSNSERILSDYNQPDADSIFDGESVDLNIIAGNNFDNGKGNVTAYFGYSKDNAVRWEDRDFAACPYTTRDGGTDFGCSGSGSMPTISRFSRSGDGAFDLVVDPETGELRNYAGSTDAFNFSAGNYLQRPRERHSYGAFANYDLNNDHTVFMDFSVVDNSTSAQVGPGGLALGRTDSINCDNPYLTGDLLATFCAAGSTTIDADGVERADLRIGRRNTDYTRVNEFTLKTQRFVGGIRGKAFEGFDYEVSFQTSSVDYNELLLNDVSTSKVTLALDAVVDPETGDVVCRSALNGVDASCVPFDVFSPNGITEAASNYITVPTLRVGDTKQLVYSASLSGDLGVYGVTSPFATEGFQTVFGVEYRKDSLSLTPDDSDTTTSQRSAVAGEVPVYEAYTEVLAPLVQDKTFMRELTLTGAYRYSDYYDTTGGQNTYSVGMAWRPIDDLRIRTQYQRATRSPNPIELFSPQDIGRSTLATLPNGQNDPCAGDFDASTELAEPYLSAAQCALTGVTADQYGSIPDVTNNIGTLSGGNPELNPEISDTWTAGFVYEPSWLSGFVASIDYFSIEVEDFISQIEPSQAIDNCISTGDEAYCSLIQRDSLGSFVLIPGESYIQSTLINTGRLKTSGVDVSMGYGFGLADYNIPVPGDVKLNYAATFTDEYNIQSLPTDDGIDCVGFHGGACNNPIPEYSHRASLEWANGNLSSVLTWRYISSVDQYTTSPTLVNDLEATSYFDVSGSYTVSESLGLRAGINNVLDQDPPLTSLAGYGGNEIDGRANTYPQVYDAQGRYIFVGATYTF